MSGKPTSDELLTAAEWLDVNEGDLDGDRSEMNSCHKVAEYLRQQAQLMDTRLLARKHKVPVKRLRQKLQELAVYTFA